MKNYLSWIIAFVILSFSSCGDDDSITSSDVSKTIIEGQWVITHFVDSDQDKTDEFNGYTFLFTETVADQGSGVVEATNGTTDLVGTWSTKDEDSSIKLILNFSISPFKELNEDWKITEKTSAKITMQHQSGGNGGVDYLTLGRE